MARRPALADLLVHPLEHFRPQVVAVVLSDGGHHIERYDRYSPRLQKHAAALITEWCDAVLFASRRFTTRSEDAGFGRQRAIAAPIEAGGGVRIQLCFGDAFGNHSGTWEVNQEHNAA